MAITQEFDCNSKTPLEESIQHCGGEVADPQHRKYDGPSTRREAITKNIFVDQRGSRIKNRKSDRLNDIEIVGYLNTKEEIHRKRILWEAMNEKNIKAKKQKVPAETKKSGAVKKATKTTEKMEPKKHSSRINYDALKSLGGDFQERCESGESSKADSPKQSKESWYEDDRSDDEIFGGDEEEDESHYQYQDEDLFDDFDT
ncbi:uncharacterized protein LOC125215876 isoform X3 [Salvia hispanica]|uniref:uncharacterized protein LOC125215876 isoform X3 n=1 Tax=Salvia hispanica TaxID=49212 RepID=UPI002009C858|nr:uncharacterized protein LOC125215876 isoform X3 [Salvia hispanica]